MQMLNGLRSQYVGALTSASYLGLLAFGLHSGEKSVWIISLVLVAAIGFFAWVSTHGRARAIAELPTSRIGSAAQG
ncbi:MAG TPA: hypothetical protein PLD78_10775, partial [Burkholderiaceae bacterium]|nr:hypothetical protein [Burkholderiaceae bacterium]